MIFNAGKVDQPVFVIQAHDTCRHPINGLMEGLM